MAQFVVALQALKDGKKVRRSKWEASSVMFVQNDELLCQRTANSNPYPYDLNWPEIKAEDWSVV